MKLPFIKLYKILVFAGKYIYCFLLKIIIAILGLFKRKDLKVIKNVINNDNLTITFLGEICNEIYSNGDINGDLNLNKIIGGSDLYFGYSDADKVSNGNIYNIRNLDNMIVDAGTIKIGCACIVFDTDNDGSLSYYEILKKLNILKRNGANYNIIYVKHDKSYIYNISKIKKLLGNLGFDFVVGIDKTIKGKRNFRTMYFSECRIAYSLGRMFLNSTEDDSEERSSKPGIAYNILLSPIKNRIRVVKEGYIPLKIDLYEDRVHSIHEIKKGNILHYVNENIENKYFLYIERLMRGMRNWRELYTLGDIFNVLGVSISDKYRYLLDFSINQICARTYELRPGNIFFFRQSFKDKNDGKPEREFKRNRLVLRAFTRRCLFVFSYKKLPGFIPYVVLEDAMEAHIKVMAWYKEKFVPAKYIGITGSIGKTSTKDMLYCALSVGAKVGKSNRNTNVQVKIGINMQSIDSSWDVYVQEIGGGRPGGASRHSRMITPDIAVVTNIGTAHLGNYESKDDLMRNKLQIVDGMKKNGTLFLNADDELLACADVECNIVYFGINNKQADYYAENIRDIDGITYFDIVNKDNVIPMQINVLGEYNVLNAVCSYAVAKKLGLNDDDIREGLQRFRTTGVRQNIVSVGDYRFFVDCYNASVDSINSSLEVLTKLVPKKNGKKIAIVGDVTGMGEHGQEINDNIARIISLYDIDTVVCYGDNASYIVEQLSNMGRNALCIETQNKLEQWMRENIMPEDVTLLKGSSKMRLDECLDDVFGFNLADQRYIDEAHYSTVRKNNMTYRVFHNYVSIRKYNGKAEKIIISDKVLGKAVRKISKGAFQNRHIREIVFGDNILHIGKNAFANCINLEKVTLNEGIKYIGHGAFKNCINLKEINLPDSLLHVNSEAFVGCESLNDIECILNTEYIEDEDMDDDSI